MNLNFKEIATASMVLFAVIDIIGNIPIIITLRKRAGHIHSEKASIIAAVFLLSFLVFFLAIVFSNKSLCFSFKLYHLW